MVACSVKFGKLELARGPRSFSFPSFFFSTVTFLCPSGVVTLTVSIIRELGVLVVLLRASIFLPGSSRYSTYAHVLTLNFFSMIVGFPLHFIFFFSWRTLHESIKRVLIFCVTWQNVRGPSPASTVLRTGSTGHSAICTQYCIWVRNYYHYLHTVVLVLCM